MSHLRKTGGAASFCNQAMLVMSHQNGVSHNMGRDAGITTAAADGGETAEGSAN